jgi:hypothetical protein
MVVSTAYKHNTQGRNEVGPCFRSPMEKPYVMLVYLYYDDDYTGLPLRRKWRWSTVARF